MNYNDSPTKGKCSWKRGPGEGKDLFAVPLAVEWLTQVESRCRSVRLSSYLYFHLLRIKIILVPIVCQAARFNQKAVGTNKLTCDALKRQSSSVRIASSDLPLLTGASIN